MEENASRSATDDLDLKIFCIPLRHDDFDGFSFAELGVRAGEKSWDVLGLVIYDTGDSVEAVDNPGVLIKYDAGVGGNGGVSDYPSIPLSSDRHNTDRRDIDTELSTSSFSPQQTLALLLLQRLALLH